MQTPSEKNIQYLLQNGFNYDSIRGTYYSWKINKNISEEQVKTMDDDAFREMVDGMVSPSFEKTV